MNNSVLVAYATKKGSTCEVAQAVAERLAERDVDVHLEPAREVESLAGVDSVVLGGALYMGRLHPDARRFLKHHRKALAALPVAVFAMGPLTLEQRDVDGSRRQLDRALSAAPEIQPVSVAIFGGVVDPSKLRFPFNRMPASDARDWDAIRAWAEEVATMLAGSEVGASESKPRLVPVA
jgi:menaquinone-dependent protoporphyrinogen oxidase